MRVLFVSNLFPPAGRGGYEQWCDEIASAFVERGHTVAVLSSRVRQPPAEDASRPFAVHRLLHTEVAGGMLETTRRLAGERYRLEGENLATVRQLVAAFRPDVAFIWGMWNISRAVPQEIEQLLGTHVAYYLCDYWLSLPSAYIQRLQEPARRTYNQWYKSLIRRTFLPQLAAADVPQLRLAHPICVSRAVCELLAARGVAVSHAKVIYGGTQVNQFDRRPAQPAGPNSRVRLLYMGRLEPLKGVHTLIRAMQRVNGGSDAVLDILGAGPADDVAHLEGMVAQANLQDTVRFLGSVPRSQVPAVLAEHDVLLFPSEWEEPFARSVLEAMAAGLVVIGTTTGGTGEILREGETGLTFPAGDAERLAAQICRIAEDAALRRRLSETGRRIVRQQYTLERMVEDLERELQIIAQPAPVTC